MKVRLHTDAQACLRQMLGAIASNNVDLLAVRTRRMLGFAPSQADSRVWLATVLEPAVFEAATAALSSSNRKPSGGVPSANGQPAVQPAASMRGGGRANRRTRRH